MSWRNYFMWGECLAFAACGRVGYDNVPLGEETTGPPGPVSVRVILPDGPVSATPVFFNDPDGSLLGVGLTGPDGTVVHEIPPGALVTVVHSNSSDASASARSVRGVVH